MSKIINNEPKECQKLQKRIKGIIRETCEKCVQSWSQEGSQSMPKTKNMEIWTSRCPLGVPVHPRNTKMIDINAVRDGVVKIAKFTVWRSRKTREILWKSIFCTKKYTNISILEQTVFEAPWTDFKFPKTVYTSFQSFSLTDNVGPLCYCVLSYL